MSENNRRNNNGKGSTIGCDAANCSFHGEADSCTAYLNDELGNVEQHLKRVLDDVHQNRLEVTSGGDGNNAARGGR